MIYKRSHRSSCYIQGFTLVELLVSMVIALFLMGGIFLTYTSGQTILTEGQRLSRMQENIRFSSDFLIRELRNAGFRDDVSLGAELFDEFADPGFAVVENGGSRLTIRMSGARSCGNAAQGGDYGDLVINTYFVEDGDLICRGTVRRLVEGQPDPVTQNFNDIRLASGIQSISFEPLCDSTPCNCTLWAFGRNDQQESILNDTCHSMLVNLTFDGPDNTEVDVQLRAAFRNIILGRLQWLSVPEPPPT